RRVAHTPEAGHHALGPRGLKRALEAQHTLAAGQVSQAERTTISVPRRSSAATSSAVNRPSARAGSVSLVPVSPVFSSRARSAPARASPDWRNGSSFLISLGQLLGHITATTPGT